MRRFTELLLLVAGMFPLLLFANGLQLEALHPAIKNHPLRRDAMIGGLLVPRGFFCPSGFVCESVFCCPRKWHCCRDGSCCEPAFYCVLASNGVIGCCPNGRICSGPVGEPNTIPPPPPPPPPTIADPAPISTFTSTSTSTSAFTSTFDFTSTSTTTLTGLMGGPTQSIENQIIDVSVLDVNMIWSDNWSLQTSSCDPSIKSKITTTENASFTYMLEGVAISSFFNYYINVVNFNTEWEVFFNGVSQITYFSNSNGFTNCTYLENMATFSPSIESIQNITVVVHGPAGSSSTSDSWSLEVTRLQLQDNLSGSAGPSTLNTATPTNSEATFTQIPTDLGPVFSAAERAQPYRLLLVPGSILLATVISILRL